MPLFSWLRDIYRTISTSACQESSNAQKAGAEAAKKLGFGEKKESQAKPVHLSVATDCDKILNLVTATPPW